MLRSLWVVGLASIVAGYALPVLAEAEQSAQTYSPNPETIVGGRDVTIPSKPVLPIYYTLPMVIKVAQDSSITSSTPITDNSTDLKVWAEAISECAKSTPVLLRESPDGDQPFKLSEEEGKVKLNASGQPVCLP